MLTQKNQAVNHGGDQEQGKLRLPVPLQCFTQERSRKPSNDQTGRPAGVQDIQVVRAILGKQRCDQRVGHSLQSAVGHGEDERTPVKEMESGHLILPRGCRKCDDGRQHMEREGRDHQLPIADPVADKAANYDSEAKSGKPGAVDVA